MSSLRLALKQSLAETGHLVAQENKQKKRKVLHDRRNRCSRIEQQQKRKLFASSREFQERGLHCDKSCDGVHSPKASSSKRSLSSSSLSSSSGSSSSSESGCDDSGSNSRDLSQSSCDKYSARGSSSGSRNGDDGSSSSCSENFGVAMDGVFDSEVSSDGEDNTSSRRNCQETEKVSAFENSQRSSVMKNRTSFNNLIDPASCEGNDTSDLPRKKQKDFFIGRSSKKSKSSPLRGRTVPPPSDEIIVWIRGMSIGKQRRKIESGVRVKVRFVTKSNKRGKDGKLIRTLKWYGGLVTDVTAGGKRVRIQYDDGTSEVSDFPDKDIVVDEEGNGRHRVSASAFLPLPLPPSPPYSNSPPEVVDLRRNIGVSSIEISFASDKLETDHEARTLNHLDSVRFQASKNTSEVMPTESKKSLTDCQFITSTHPLQNNLNATFSRDSLEMTVAKSEALLARSVDTDVSSNARQLSPVVKSSPQADFPPARPTPTTTKLSAVSESPFSHSNGSVREAGSIFSSSSCESHCSFDHASTLPLGAENRLSNFQPIEVCNIENGLESSVLPTSVSNPSGRGSNETKVIGCEDESDIPIDPSMSNRASYNSSLTIKLIAPKAMRNSSLVLASDVKLHADDSDLSSNSKSSGTLRMATSGVPFRDPKMHSTQNVAIPGHDADNKLKITQQKTAEINPKWSDNAEVRDLIRKINQPEPTSVDSHDLAGNKMNHSINSGFVDESSKKKTCLKPCNEGGGNLNVDNDECNEHPVIGPEMRLVKNLERRKDNKEKLPSTFTTSKKLTGQSPCHTEPNNLVPNDNYSFFMPKDLQTISGSTGESYVTSIVVANQSTIDEENNREDVPPQAGQDRSTHSLPADSSLGASHHPSVCGMSVPGKDSFDAVDSSSDEEKITNLSPSARSDDLSINRQTSAKEDKTVDSEVETTNKPKIKVDLKRLYPLQSASKDTGVNSDDDDSEDDHWVQCDRCLKWRLLPSTVNMDSLPERWYCELNIYDLKRNHCGALEQTVKDVKSEKEAATRALAVAALSEKPSDISVLNSSPTVSKQISTSEHPAESIYDGSFAAQYDTKRTMPSSKIETKLMHERSMTDSESSKPTSSPTSSDLAVSVPSPPSVLGYDSNEGAAAKMEMGTKSSFVVDDVGSVEDNDGEGSDTTATSSLPAARLKVVTKSRKGCTYDDEKDAKTLKGKKAESERQEWVQCEKCEKWRRLPPRIKAEDLPEVWYCSMNTWEPRTASCTVAEDTLDSTQREYTILNNGANNVAAPNSGKLSYRHLIFGTQGRRQNRPISERTRATGSLFPSVALDPNLETASHPLVMYANSSAFVCRGGLNGSKGRTDEAKPMSFLQLMSHSKLWEELYSGARAMQSLSSGFVKTNPNETCLYARLNEPEYSRPLKAMVYFVLDTNTLAAHEVLLEAQCRDWDDCRWTQLRASCTIEIVIQILDKLVSEGLVDAIHQPDAGLMGSDVMRYRRAWKELGPPSNAYKNHGGKTSRCMKIAKPWKKTHTHLEDSL